MRSATHHLHLSPAACAIFAARGRLALGPAPGCPARWHLLARLYATAADSTRRRPGGYDPRGHEGDQMDDETRRVLGAMADQHDKLALQVAALVAVVGAISERYPVNVTRVLERCALIAEGNQTDLQELRRLANDLLLGLLPEDDGPRGQPN
jgi:hypothetical protein